MSENEHEPMNPADKDAGLAAVLRKIRYDLTAAQGKLTEAMRMVATLDIADAGERVPCPRCDLPLPGPMTLAEHLFNSHDGPVPAHWEAIEARSAA